MEFQWPPGEYAFDSSPQLSVHSSAEQTSPSHMDEPVVRLVKCCSLCYANRSDRQVIPDPESKAVPTVIESPTISPGVTTFDEQ